jgi:hypothetical protein
MRSKTPAQLLSYRLSTYSLSEASRYLRHASARLSEHYLKTFKTGEKNMFSPPPNSVTHYLLLLLSLFTILSPLRGRRKSSVALSSANTERPNPPLVKEGCPFLKYVNV